MSGGQGLWRGVFWGLRLGFHGPRLRALGWLTALSLFLVTSIALIERAHSPLLAPERSIDMIRGYLLPLLSFSTVGIVCAGRTPATNVWPLARFGVSRRLLVAGMGLGCALAAALVAMLATLIGVAIAYGNLPGRNADLVTSCWIVATGAVAYTWLFMLMWSFQRSQRSRFWAAFRTRRRAQEQVAIGRPQIRVSAWRYVVLVADFVLGISSHALAAVWPRAHLRNLLGHGGIAGLSQVQSSAALWLLTLCCALACVWRSRD